MFFCLNRGVEAYHFTRRLQLLTCTTYNDKMGSLLRAVKLDVVINEDCFMPLVIIPGDLTTTEDQRIRLNHRCVMQKDLFSKLARIL